MTPDHSHPFPEAARVFVVANTPTYLFKHFRSIQRIQALATEMSTEAVVKRCTELAALGKPAMDDELSFYVHLVALCFKPLSEIRGELDDLSKSPFRWAKPLINLIVSHAKASDRIVWKPQFKPSIRLSSEQRLSSTSDTHTDIQLSPDSGDQS
ncbi:MAG: hypothetical protein IH830_03880 [Planctomycetes bacterium]|nr:hypothetical protein [Planctomycetota bacterium]